MLPAPPRWKRNFVSKYTGKGFWSEKRENGEAEDYGYGGRDGERGLSYARRVGAVPLVADRALSSDIAVNVGVGVGLDVAGATASVGGDWVRHLSSVLSSEIRSV